MLIRSRSHFAPEFQPALSCSYDEALRMTKSSAPLSGDALRWYHDALLGRCRVIQEPRRVGIPGLSVVTHHVMFALLGNVTEEWLVHLPRGLKELQRLTGHGERTTRRALAELMGQIDCGPRLLHVISGSADGERVFQFLHPPLSPDFTSPERRPSRGLTQREQVEQQVHMYAFNRMRKEARASNGRGGPERKPRGGRGDRGNRGKPSA